jgi:hypothetical protein
MLAASQAGSALAYVRSAEISRNLAGTRPELGGRRKVIQLANRHPQAGVHSGLRLALKGWATGRRQSLDVVGGGADPGLHGAEELG